MVFRTWSAFFFFFNDTATTEIYTLSLHDALPIYPRMQPAGALKFHRLNKRLPGRGPGDVDRKSTRLNSSHLVISYAVFCLKKKKTPKNHPNPGPSKHPDLHHTTQLTRTTDSTYSV